MKKFYKGDIVACNEKNRYWVTNFGVPCEFIRYSKEYENAIIVRCNGNDFTVDGEVFSLIRRKSNIEYVV